MESVPQFYRHSGAEPVGPRQSFLYSAGAGQLLEKHERQPAPTN